MACDCREEYVKRLESVAEAAERASFTHKKYGSCSWLELDESLQALRGEVKKCS